MLYRLLADFLVILHLLFILFGLLGGLLFFWRRWTILLHLPSAIWICLIEFQGWICPLTPLENRLRLAGGAAGYEGGFVEQYLIPIIYPPGLTRDIQLVLGGLAIGLNVAVYFFVIRSWKSRK